MGGCQLLESREWLRMAGGTALVTNRRLKSRVWPDVGGGTLTVVLGPPTMSSGLIRIANGGFWVVAHELAGAAAASGACFGAGSFGGHLAIGVMGASRTSWAESFLELL